MNKILIIKKKSNVTFGIFFFILFSIIGLYPLKSGGAIKIWSVILSSVFLIITLQETALNPPTNLLKFLKH